MASFVPTFKLTKKITLGLMLNGITVNNGQWVKTKDGLGRLLTKPMFKGLKYPLKVTTVKYDSSLSFKENTAKFKRAVGYTKR